MQPGPDGRAELRDGRDARRAGMRASRSTRHRNTGSGARACARRAKGSRLTFHAANEPGTRRRVYQSMLRKPFLLFVRTAHFLPPPENFRGRARGRQARGLAPTGTIADARHRGRHERPAYDDDDEECWPKGKAMGDRELLVVSGKAPRRGLYVRLAHALYGDGSSDAQLAHAGFLALLMCNIVGVYWLLRSLKDSVFTTVVGIEYQVRPRARARVGAGGRAGPHPNPNPNPSPSANPNATPNPNPNHHPLPTSRRPRCSRSSS